MKISEREIGVHKVERLEQQVTSDSCNNGKKQN